MDSLGGDGWVRMMTVVIVLSALTSVLSMLMTGPRVYSQMARDGYLPQLFAPERGVPVWAIVVQAILSILIVLLPTCRS